MKAPIRDSGMAIIGMITERGEPKKIKTTNATIRPASISVCSTYVIELCTKPVES
jgi:hypothetical protein